MAIIDVNTIGTILPSVKARALPDNAAQIAHNLLPSTTEFRPLADDLNVAVSGIANPQTLYRLARDDEGELNDDYTTGWTVAAAVRQYVKGQLNDDATERTYYTFGDGSAPPRVMDATGEDRKLGVPAPATKPVVTLGVVDEFTTEERALAIVAAKKTIAETVRAAAVASWVGAFGPPTDEGYVYLQDDDKTTAPSQASVARVFRLSSTGGTYTRTISDAYIGTAADFDWVFTPGAGAAFAVSTTDPAWQGGAGNDHVFLHFKALARGYGFNWTTLEAALAAIPMPGAAGEFLLNEDDLTGPTGIITRLQSYLDTDDDRLRPKYQAVLSRSSEMRQLLEQAPPAGATDESMAAAFQAKKGELEAAVNTLTEHYRWLGPDANIAELLNAVGIYYGEEDIDSQVTPGVNRTIDSRFYIVTYVTDWGEESAQSPLSDMVEADQNDTVGITIPNAPAGREIVGWRLYRNNRASNMSAFQLVVDRDAVNAVLDEDGDFDYFDIDTLTYNDNKKAEELEESCPSITWAEPPANLRGLVSLGNGIMAGYFDNTVCFCEPFKPYAWPVEYQKTVEYPITALGGMEQTAVVAHTGGTDYIGGASPASMSRRQGVSKQTCVSARGMVPVDGGVAFPSPDGYCLATPGGVEVATAAHFTLEDWRAIQPETIVAAYHERTLFFRCDGPEDEQVCYALAGGRLGTVDLDATAFFVDQQSDQLYAVGGSVSTTAIRRVFGGTGRRTGLWRSKAAVMGQRPGFMWLYVDSDFEDEGDVVVRWIGDNTERVEKTVSTRTAVKLPPGKYRDHELEVESTERWTRLIMASSTEELERALG